MRWVIIGCIALACVVVVVLLWVFCVKKMCKSCLRVDGAEIKADGELFADGDNETFVPKSKSLRNPQPTVDDDYSDVHIKDDTFDDLVDFRPRRNIETETSDVSHLSQMSME